MGSALKPPPDPNLTRINVDGDQVEWCGRVRRNLLPGSVTTVTCDWSGTKMSFDVVGKPKGVWVRMDGQSNCFNVHVDGVHTLTFYAESGAADYCVAHNVESDPANITLVKRTEAHNGVLKQTPVIMINIGLPPSCSVAKPSAKNHFPRKIEFVGDSDSTALGNLGSRTAISLMGALGADVKQQDVERGWISFVARAFHAEFHGIAVSGIGAQWGPDGSVESSMRKTYNRTLYTQTGEASDMEPVDLVVIYLGGSDVEKGKLKSNTSTHLAFIDGYADLVAKIKYHRPNTPVLCIIPGEASLTGLETKEDQKLASQILQSLIPQAVEKSGLRLVICKKNETLHDLNDDSQWGSNAHYSVKGHVIFAHGVIAMISELMGWQPVRGWENVSHTDDKFLSWMTCECRRPQGQKVYDVLGHEDTDRVEE